MAIVATSEWQCKKCNHKWFAPVEHPCPKCDAENFQKWLKKYKEDNDWM